MSHDRDEPQAGVFGADDDHFDLFETIGGSNRGAYQRNQSRTGPPLAYVAEKSRNALEQIRAAHRSIGEDGGGRAAVRAAFHYGLVSHLALNNMLSLAGDHRMVGQGRSWAPCQSRGMMRIMETVSELLGTILAGAVATLPYDHPASTRGDRR
jgi:hypothetical protein